MKTHSAVRLVPELNSGATCWYLRGRKQPNESMKELMNNISFLGRTRFCGLPPGSAAFCSGDGDLTGVDELEGKLLLV